MSKKRKQTHKRQRATNAADNNIRYSRLTGRQLVDPTLFPPRHKRIKAWMADLIISLAAAFGAQAVTLTVLNAVGVHFLGSNGTVINGAELLAVAFLIHIILYKSMGQTAGQRWAGLRVFHDNQPIGIIRATIRVLLHPFVTLATLMIGNYSFALLPSRRSLVDRLTKTDVLLDL